MIKSRLLLAIIALSLCCIAWGPFGLQLSSMVSAVSAGAFTVSFEDESTETDTDTSVTVTAPAIDTGDMIAVALEFEVGNQTITPPSGFAEVEDAYGATTAHGHYLYWKEATSGDASASDFTWSWTDSSPMIITMAVFSKDGGSWVDPTTANYSNSSTGSSAAQTTGTVTSQDGSAVFAAWSNDGNNSVSIAPSGMTLINYTLQGTAFSALATYYEEIATGGSENPELTWSGASTNAASIMVLYAQ